MLAWYEKVLNRIFFRSALFVYINVAAQYKETPEIYY